MLRLLSVALPLVVALPAAFDEQDANAIQFEVRSPPESRPLLPAAPREINTPHNSTAKHSTPNARHPCAHIPVHAPRHKSAGKTTHPAINIVTNLFEPRDTNPPQVCPPALPAATHA
jgi:hypothetical protein